MPTPAQTFEFTLDRNVHWKHLSSHECKRQEAMLEFLITESTYYQRLTILHEVFYQQASDEILSKVERSKIFQNLDELLLRAGLLLSDLLHRQAKEKGQLSTVSDIFLDHLKCFDCFQTYCIGHEEASQILRKKIESTNRFSKFIKKAISDPRCLNLDLASFLLEPVQRLARYPLLLKQILHYTDKSHADHQKIFDAVMASEAFLQKVNEAVRFHESQSRLSSIQSHLLVQLDGENDVGFELVGTTRKNTPRTLIMEGTLWKARSKRKLLALLLTDMILLLEPLSQGNKFSFYRQPFSLNEIILRDIDFLELKLKPANGLKSFPTTTFPVIIKPV